MEWWIQETFGNSLDLELNGVQVTWFYLGLWISFDGSYSIILCTLAFKTKSVVQQFSTNYAGKKVSDSWVF